MTQHGLIDPAMPAASSISGHCSASTMSFTVFEQNAGTEDRDNSRQCKDFSFCARIADVVEHPHRVDHDRDKLGDSGRLDCSSFVELWSELANDQQLSCKLKADSVKNLAANQIPKVSC